MRRSIGWLVVAGAFSWICSAVLIAHITRALGPEAFGILTFAQATTAYLSILINPGLVLWGIREVATTNGRARELLLSVNGLLLIFASLAYSTLMLGCVFLYPTANTSVLLATGLSLFTTAISVQWICQSLERFDLVALNQTLGQGITMVLTIKFVSSPEDLTLIPILQALSQGFGVAVCIFALGVRGHLPRRNDKDAKSLLALRNILRAAMPLGVAAILVTVLHHANTLYLYAFQNAKEVGIFSAGYRTMEQISLLAATLSGLFISRISRAYTVDASAAEKLFQTYMGLLLYGAVLISATWFTYAQPIALYLYGTAYSNSTDVTRIFAIAIVGNFAAIGYTMRLVAIGSDRGYLTAIIAGLGTAVLGGLLMVPLTGARGAAYVIAGIDMVTLITALQFCKYPPLFKSYQPWIRPLVFAALIVVWYMIATRLSLAIYLGATGASLIGLVCILNDPLVRKILLNRPANIHREMTPS